MYPTAHQEVFLRKISAERAITQHKQSAKNGPKVLTMATNEDHAQKVLTMATNEDHAPVELPSIDDLLMDADGRNTSESLDASQLISKMLSVFWHAFRRQIQMPLLILLLLRLVQKLLHRSAALKLQTTPRIAISVSFEANPKDQRKNVRASSKT